MFVFTAIRGSTMRYRVIFAVMLVVIAIADIRARANLITCSDTTCEIALWDVSSPIHYIYKTIALIPPEDGNGNKVPIPEDNRVAFSYDGQTYTITCNGLWQDLGNSYPEITNKISCTVDRSGDVIPGTKVTVNLVLYDQRVYDNIYAECPGYTVDSSLQDTSESSPFCTTENDLADISACKWQKQNINDSTLNERGVPLNQWVVYSKTTVNNLVMSYEIPESPPYDENARLCAVDLNQNGIIDEEGEIATCTSTPQGWLCPIGATNCEIITGSCTPQSHTEYCFTTYDYVWDYSCGIAVELERADHNVPTHQYNNRQYSKCPNNQVPQGAIYDGPTLQGTSCSPQCTYGIADCATCSSESTVYASCDDGEGQVCIYQWVYYDDIRHEGYGLRYWHYTVTGYRCSLNGDTYHTLFA